MKKFSWIVALLIALSMALVGCGAEPPTPGGGESGTVILELADIIGETTASTAITELPEGITKSGSPTLTVTADGKGITVSGRGDDYHGIDIDLSKFIDPAGSYELEFGGFTTDKGSQSTVGGAAVKVGQPEKPYDDLFALVTVTANTAVEGKKGLAPVFGKSPGQMKMRISANEEPYTNGGHKENFTVTKFVITVK